MFSDIAFQELPAFAAIQIDYVYAVLAKPVDAAFEGPALSNDHGADPELAHQAAAIPAWVQGGDHYEVPVAPLAAGAAKSIGLSVDAWITLLHAAIVTPAHQFTRFSEDRRADRNTALGSAEAGFVEGDGQHRFIGGGAH